MGDGVEGVLAAMIRHNVKEVPIVDEERRVVADLTMIDLTGCDDVEEGDDVILLGHGGGEAVDAAGLAARAGTIPYEVLTSIGSKARKRYRAGQDGTCCAAAEELPGAEQNKHR